MVIDLKVFSITKEIWEAVYKVWANGGEVYLVGGCIRDYFLGRKCKDLDFCVTGLSWDEMEELFPDNKIQGISFPVFNIASCEFALARKERKIACGYHGFEPWVDKSLTIEDDLIRRDFTINAIAINLKDGQLVDPHNGMQDIKNKLLSAVSSAFAEDPLRVYRGARFAAQLGFRVGYDTIMLMRSLKGELEYVTPDRVSIEIQKVMSSAAPWEFFKVLNDAESLDIHFPEIQALVGVPQTDKFHKYDAFGHTMEVLKVASKLTTNPIHRYAALVHDLGKGITPQEKWPHHPGHEEAGVPLVEKLGERLKGLPKDWTQAGKMSAAFHMKARTWKTMRAIKTVDMITGVARTPLGLDGLAIIAQADHMGRGFVVEEDQNPYDMRDFGKEMLQQVTGNTIAVKPGVAGKAFGEALRIARAKWLEERM